MSKYNHTVNFPLVALSLALLFSLFLLTACSTGADSLIQATPTTENTAVTDVDVFPTRSPSPTLTADPTSVNQLITSLTATGATVVNNGRTEQGLFPGDDIYLWCLTINGTNVNVYEFSDTAARQAISDIISPTGYEFTVTDGDTPATIHWDGEGVPHFWALDNLIINYWGEDVASLATLNAVLGPPFANGSQPYRPEPYSGATAGTGEYGVSFQYDPYLAVDIQPRLVDAFTEDNGMDYLLLPQHLAFIFSNSYADADPLLQRQQLNLETMPQIVIYPATAYATISNSHCRERGGQRGQGRTGL